MSAIADPTPEAMAPFFFPKRRTETNINVSQISSGIYIVKILFTDGYSITKKIIL
jgi:hypothetical protein